MSGNGLSAREQRLLDFAKSGVAPSQVAAETGWPLELITRESIRLAGEYDNIYDDVMQLQLNKQTLRSHIARLEAEAKDGNKDAWKPLIDAVARQNQQIDKSMERAQADLEKVNASQARAMMQIIQSTFDRTLGELQARYPEVSTDEIESTFRNHLTLVAGEWDSR